MWYHAQSRTISAGQKLRTVADDLALRGSLAIKHDITWSNSVLLAAILGDGSVFVQGSSFLTLLDATETPSFPRSCVSSFMSRYWHQCLAKPNSCKRQIFFSRRNSFINHRNLKFHPAQHISTFLSKYRSYCFDKRTNGKIIKAVLNPLSLHWNSNFCPSTYFQFSQQVLVLLEDLFMAEFIAKTAQRKHAMWQRYDALSEARFVWSSSGEKLVVLGPWRSYEAHSFSSWLLSLPTPFNAPSRSRYSWWWSQNSACFDLHRRRHGRSTETSKRRLISNWIVTEPFLVGFSQTSHPHLANYKTFATMYLVLVSDKSWLQTKPAMAT